MVIVCDQGGCPARATREFLFDNGHTLYACNHHADAWFPAPASERFNMEPHLIVT